MSKPSPNAICYRCGHQGHNSTFCLEDRISKEMVEEIKKKQAEQEYAMKMQAYMMNYYAMANMHMYGAKSPKGASPM